MSNKHTLAEQIDAVLPQIQCGQCGFDGCKPYANAIAQGRADINQCPPGDNAIIEKLAALLNIAPKPLNTAHGHPKPKAVAVIDEAHCIGCTFCLRACPVDAIVGAAKQMHTVISEECTGCERCIAPCPMDCISMQPPSGPVTPEIQIQSANRARERYHFRLSRLERDKQAYTEKLERNIPVAGTTKLIQHTSDTKQAIIQAAIERAKTVHARANFPKRTSDS